MDKVEVVAADKGGGSPLSSEASLLPLLQFESR